MLHAMTIAALLATGTFPSPPALSVAPHGPTGGGAPALVVASRREAVVAAPAGTARPPPTVGPFPACFADFCAPRVAVPGYEQTMMRPSRTELAALYLERTQLEPFSTIAHGFIASGLRLDYTPPARDGNSAPTRWGTFFVRLRFRVDAFNVPVFASNDRR